jgi:hypothetical protein
LCSIVRVAHYSVLLAVLVSPGGRSTEHPVHYSARLPGLSRGDAVGRHVLRVSSSRRGAVGQGFALGGRLLWVSVSTKGYSRNSNTAWCTGWLHPRVSSKACPARKKGPECLGVTECLGARGPQRPGRCGAPRRMRSGMYRPWGRDSCYSRNDRYLRWLCSIVRVAHYSVLLAVLVSPCGRSTEHP